MTVYIEKPSLNLREELASLRNQGGYEEQQFWMDGLVTNGTFDANTSGWFASNATLSAASSNLLVTNTASTYGFAYQGFPTIVGKTYKVLIDVVAVSPSFIIRIGDDSTGSTNQKFQATGTSLGTQTTTFVATASTTYIRAGVYTTTSGNSATFDNVSVFETDGTDVVHRMPKGWVPLHVYEDGLLQREGAANDYEVVYDGFDYYVKPSVAPSATTQTCVIGVRK